MNTEGFIDYTKILASVIECQEKQDSSIEHEWIFMFKVEEWRQAIKKASELDIAE